MIGDLKQEGLSLPSVDETVVVLASGGIDSSAVLALCNQHCNRVSGLFVDYDQPCAESEWRAVQGVGRHFGISVERVEAGFGLVSSKGEYFGRNALLVMIAASVKEVRPLVIGIGIHALSPYYDTTPLFVRHIGRVLDGYSDGSVKLFAPFLGDTKSEVVQLADQLGLPLEATYSCERQDAPACGQCPSCQDREAVK